MTSIIVIGVTLCVVMAAAEEYFGKSIGAFSTLDHNVKGNVYAVNRRQIRIVNLYYDGTAPAAVFWVGKKGVAGASPDKTGIMMPDERANKSRLGYYDNADITLTLPDNLQLKDILWIAIWCQQVGVNFGSVSISDSLLPIPTLMSAGEFSRKAHGWRTGQVTIADSRTFLIPQVHYDGRGPQAYFMVGKTGIPNTAGTIILDENGSNQILKPYSGQDIIIQLPLNMTIYDITWLSAYCIQFKMNFGHIDIDASKLNVPSHRSTLYMGKFLGALRHVSNSVSGRVYAVDKTKIRLAYFSYDGKGAETYFWVGKKGSTAPDSSGVIMKNEHDSESSLGKYVLADLLLTLPNNIELGQVSWISIWNNGTGKSFGQYIFPSQLQAPAPHNLGSMAILPPDISSEDVTIIDSQTLKINKLTFNSSQTGANIVVRLRNNNDAFIRIDDSRKKSPTYSSEDVMLALPGNISLGSISKLSILVPTSRQQLAYINFPESDQLNVPPFMPVKPLPYPDYKNDESSTKPEVCGGILLTVLAFIGALQFAEGI